MRTKRIIPALATAICSICITAPVLADGGSAAENDAACCLRELETIIPVKGGLKEVAFSMSVTDMIDLLCGCAAANGETEIMTASLNGEDDIILTKNTATGETRVWQRILGTQKAQLHTDTFTYDDTGYKYGDILNINSIAVYKDRVYAGCDGGKVIVFTACVKCYQLRKVCDFDIKTMEIANGMMTVSDGAAEKTIDMADIGGDSIEAGEALQLYARGARLIDVRTAAEFAQSSYAGSVNIPLSEIYTVLEEYDPDDALIFYCAGGARAAQALMIAKEMGFTNVYNLGSIDKLL